MDAVTMFGIAGFGGALLSGVIGYAKARQAGEPFDAWKFGQTVITGLVVGVTAVSAGMAAVSPEGNALAAALAGLLIGYGSDAVRGDVGLKN